MEDEVESCFERTLPFAADGSGILDWVDEIGAAVSEAIAFACACVVVAPCP